MNFFFTSASDTHNLYTIPELKMIIELILLELIHVYFRWNALARSHGTVCPGMIGCYMHMYSIPVYKISATIFNGIVSCFYLNPRPDYAFDELYAFYFWFLEFLVLLHWLFCTNHYGWKRLAMLCLISFDSEVTWDLDFVFDTNCGLFVNNMKLVKCWTYVLRFARRLFGSIYLPCMLNIQLQEILFNK